MISKSNLDQQLRRIHFDSHGWGRSEVKELCNILLPDEAIDECANGYYEAGFALLVATTARLLLVDKKPLNYLTVEDMRFDMINEFDYSHRLIGAEVSVSSGMKTLHFTSWNQPRLRRLLGYVQYRVAAFRQQQQQEQEAQQVRIEQLNQQLLLLAAQQQGVLLRPAAGMTRVVAEAAGPPATTSSQHVSPGQVSLAAVKRVVPVISAYTRLPRATWQRRFGQ
ncbi:MAG TPA: PH domain-containing protein [Candidatus Saccharimonadales bacterium]|nr:PH domain-containing protein [Candidatus Saccharimonadales bacterium]